MEFSAAMRSPYLVRAPLIVREMLLAFLSEADSIQHPLVGVFGYDEKTFEFVRKGTSASLLKLANNYVKAKAISFKVNERLLKSLLKTMKDNQFLACREETALESIYSHRQVIRELVMFMSDSLADAFICLNDNGVISFEPEARRMLSGVSAWKLEWLATQMVERRCIQFSIDKDKILKRTYSSMFHERREGIKDLLVVKKATYGLMSFLFTDENLHTVKARRFRLGAPPLKGRSKTRPWEDYVEFVYLWTANPEMSDLERFLMAHRKLGYDFDVLWALYQKAEEEEDLEQSVLRSPTETSDLACQIQSRKKTS